MARAAVTLEVPELWSRAAQIGLWFSLQVALPHCCDSQACCSLTPGTGWQMLRRLWCFVPQLWLLWTEDCFSNVVRKSECANYL